MLLGLLLFWQPLMLLRMLSSFSLLRVALLQRAFAFVYVLAHRFLFQRLFLPKISLVWLRPDVVPRCFQVLSLLASGLVTRRNRDSRLDVASMLAPTVRHIPTFLALLIVIRPLKLSLRVLLALVLVFQVSSPLLSMFAIAHFSFTLRVPPVPAP